MESNCVECPLLYMEMAFTHQPWQQCTCCHAHHSQTHGYRQKGRSGVCPSDYMSKEETHDKYMHTFDCDWQRARKDQRKVYFTCTLFNLLLSFHPLRLLILLSSHLFLDSLVEGWRMFPRPSVSITQILNEWLCVKWNHVSRFLNLLQIIHNQWIYVPGVDLNFFVICISH